MTHTQKKAQPFEFILAPLGKRNRGRGKPFRKIGKATPKEKAKTIFPGQHRGRKSGNLQLRELNCFSSRALHVIVKRKNGNVCCSMRAAKKKTHTHKQKTGKIRGKSRSRVEDENI